MPDGKVPVSFQAFPSEPLGAYSSDFEFLVNCSLQLWSRDIKFICVPFSGFDFLPKFIMSRFLEGFLVWSWFGLVFNSPEHSL